MWFCFFFFEAGKIILQVPVPGFLDWCYFQFCSRPTNLFKEKIGIFQETTTVLNNYLKKNKGQQIRAALYLEDIASALKSIPNVVTFAGAGPFCQLGVITGGKFTAASVILVRSKFKIFNFFIARCAGQF